MAPVHASWHLCTRRGTLAESRAEAASQSLVSAWLRSCPHTAAPPKNKEVNLPQDADRRFYHSRGAGAIDNVKAKIQDMQSV